ncbi:hypothetical protein BCR43DRAFT_566524 [Syncephalastrum racemosum]|uniref:Peroxisomal biogenesis factor 11 n=1 Tax=Syncephalastrum racemosum TaxID=13706 RepID=A0A1X2H3I7_SYNRA|nr:hypothetical protein BCR43DRAFT_566524 [Syncephalastrum racemosum]
MLSASDIKHPVPLLPTPAASPPPTLRTFSADVCYSAEKLGKPRPDVPATFQKFIKELDGRDKGIKVLQYLFKILLHYRLVNAARWKTMVSQFSMTRKILRLGSSIAPIRELADGASFWKSVVLVNEIGNGVADDVYCFYKLGVVSSKIGNQAEWIAIYCWFAAILHDIRANVAQLQKCRDDPEKYFMTQVSIAKLSMDGVFCACDIWKPRFSDGVQAWSGFFSGSLSAYKLWKKCIVVKS